MSAESISTIAGPAGIGALCLLGVFLFLDGRAPSLFPTVETYAKTATWGVVAAVPVLVMAYVAGLCVSAAGVYLVQHFSGHSFAQEATDIAKVASISADKSAAIQIYSQLLQDRAVFAGCTIAFVILSVGAVSEIDNLPHLKSAIITMAIAVLLLGALMFWLAERKGAEAHLLATTVALAAAEDRSKASEK